MRKLRIVSIFIIALFLICACNPLRGPVVDERDDGEILGTLIVSRGRYKEGETVEVTFTIENISNEPILLSRDDSHIQDLIIFNFPAERRWSDEVGEALLELKLDPGESSTIEWEIEDLDDGVYTLIGYWWSTDIREVEVVVITEYGATRY